MSITFERNVCPNDLIFGTKMSAKGMQSMTSTGIPSFDRLFGGGLPLNSMTILEEDTYCQYSSLISKCFVSNSIDCNHKTIICSPNISSKKSRFLKELPVGSTQKVKQIDNTSDEMHIAWRYKSQPLVDTLSSESHYDFGSHITETALNSADIEFCSHDSCLDFISSLKETKNVVRILIEGLGSPLSPIPMESLPKFVYKLKCLVRKVSNVLCLITMSSQLLLLSNYSYVRSRVHNIADGVVQLITFDERTVTPYTEYEGLFQVIKLPKLNFFNYYSVPETLDLGFQLKNNSRFLIVDKLCLPPDLSENVSRTTGCATGCVTPSNHQKLDF